jgi:hydrogenase maturation protease
MNGESGQRGVRVLLCGERLRGDDAAALLAAELLPAEARESAELVEVGQLSVETLLEIPDGTALIVADAAVGVPAGVVVCLPFEAVTGAIGAGRGAPASSHSLPPDQILALAAELRGSLPRGVFVGIGGAAFGFGERLSAPVAAGLAGYATTLAKEIRRLAAGGR